MSDLGKWLVLIGLSIAVLGGFVWLLGRLPFFGNLPGDIRIQGENFGCFVPLASMLLLSLLLTVIVNIVIRLLNR
jgi:hypothetical protein